MAKKTLGVNPWTKIWVSPRETIKKIVQFNTKYGFLILSFLYGLPMLLHTAQNLSLGEDFGVRGIVLAAVVLATFVGMLGITIGSALVTWTGKWIGGKANFQKVRTAVSWSNVPNILSIIVWGVLIYWFRDNLFFDEFNDLNFTGTDMTIVGVALFVQAVVAIWSFIILVKGIGQVQGFSAWKGVLNVAIPFFMVGILIWLITWAVWIASGMPMAY